MGALFPPGHDASLSLARWLEPTRRSLGISESMIIKTCTPCDAGSGQQEAHYYQ